LTKFLVNYSPNFYLHFTKTKFTKTKNMVPLGAAMLTSSTPGLVFTNAVLGFCFTFILKIAHVVLVLSVIMFGVSLMDVLSRSSSNFAVVEEEKTIAVAEERTMEQCSICWVQMTKTNAVKLGCNHYFHQQCAERWHLINPTCALCRYKI